MEKVSAFKKTISQYNAIAVDSSIFIYKFEQNPDFEPFASVIFKRINTGDITLSTSVITVAEVLTQPFLLGKHIIVYLYETVFSELPYFTINIIDYEISRLGAQLRATYNLLLPDALAIASAMQQEAEIFITNDRGLKKIKEIPIICLKDFI